MSRNAPDLASLQERLGYRFKNTTLLEQALTHVTAVNGKRREDYQRLEFLGDRVLSLAVAEMLYLAFPKEDEGNLARRHSAMVRNEAWVEIAMLLDLGVHLRLGSSESGSGGRHKESILGDACEALFGAVFLDSDYPTVRAIIDRLWRPLMTRARAEAPRDAKSMLQEWALAHGMPLPHYREIERSGPDHKPVFRVAAELPGRAPAEGVGASKREAERAAASEMLTREGLLTDLNG